MGIIAKNIKKQYVVDCDSIKSVIFKNIITDTNVEIVKPQEFVISYCCKRGIFEKMKSFGSQDATLVNFSEDKLEYVFSESDAEWKIVLLNKVVNNYLSTSIQVACSNKNIFIDYIAFLQFSVDNYEYIWSRPVPSQRSTIPPYFTTLGQPVYYKDMFFGIEDMCADNQVSGTTMSLRYYYGQTIAQLGDNFESPSYVVGCAIADNMIDCQNAFFEYVQTFARQSRFRIQYNSWYDNMLNISTESIESSFVDMNAKFKKSGLRDLDCYVVDDGWVDYKKSEFWAFNSKFKEGFAKESKLVKSFGSKFGVWFGPIGGYSESGSYAKKLGKLGYFSNNKAMQICVGDPRYINSLIDKMIEFVKDYDVDYYKIDGFAYNPCTAKNHNHPVGGYKNLYFYTFQWKNWCQGFERLRQQSPNIFLNITSHSNCSAWLLKYADSVWINNAADMNYEGSGSDLDQCLNYRDGRYFDFTAVRQLQFPLAYIYNHEPCYAEKNYNPPMPRSTKRVVYTDLEFEKYLYMCMMRGTGFIELYYSPSMMTDEKLAVNAKVLKWAESNFDLIQKVKFFGDVPSTKCIYGYVGFDDKKGLVAIRNSSDKPLDINLDLFKYSNIEGEPTLKAEYGTLRDIQASKSHIVGIIAPYEVKIIKMKYDN